MSREQKKEENPGAFHKRRRRTFSRRIRILHSERKIADERRELRELMESDLLRVNEIIEEKVARELGKEKKING